ncbi:Membrane-bound lytic murein transglycosylase A precursor [Georgfuchsia toluolica]|uniref:peptidoglycan lytic exotransglycosylase n=1 Tax=Georgfuchsia toluolica TaxID=424218 RepID=A0A916J6V0_9PROT|nr:MltA domain-containing protein [Georgfuchsia toluolica]CAG4885063.1 Membrane-bound lytic murein transglycosylase A precursor [Georgfuchsia toluolica]
MQKKIYLPALMALLLAGCAAVPPSPPPAPCVCPPVEVPVPPKPVEKPLQPASWSDLPGWGSDDLTAAFDAFLASCKVLERRALWSGVCASARGGGGNDLRAWFEAQLQPWQLVNPDGSRDGLITGYYEPVIKGSRKPDNIYRYPVFGVPNDLITVDLSEVYPELRNLRLRGRLEGRKLVPYYSRADWTQQEVRRADDAIMWTSDPIDFFFLQIQGSGQVDLPDGQRVRISYADQNGHPYRSVGKWLAEQGEMKIEQTSMQGIKAWAAANPKRLQELLNVNPSMVFFRELPVEGSGPPGALAMPLTPERSIAVDARTTPLGSPVWLSTTQPNSDELLQRLVLAQDTGGAIRGPVRADFYWGSGAEAGAKAGRMKQRGRMWVLLPKGYAPSQ